MFHITIRPDTFVIDKKLNSQNPYSIPNEKVNRKIALEQHKNITNQLSRNVNYVVKKSELYIPDIVFIANGGLSLPRLPESVVILPWMKFGQRRNEISYLKEIYEDLNIKTIDFPGSSHSPYEGAAESKWFNNGEVLVMGYGFRSSKETVHIMRTLLNTIYTSFGIEPPIIISFQLQSFKYYHLDIAMLELSQSECIIHKNAIKPKDILRLNHYLGTIHLIDTEDSFCLNSIVEGENLLTHKFKDTLVKKQLEEMSGKKIIECDTSEFEKAGGSVRCMVMDIFDLRLIKRKKRTPSSPSSPKL